MLDTSDVNMPASLAKLGPGGEAKVAHAADQGAPARLPDDFQVDKAPTPGTWGLRHGRIAPFERAPIGEWWSWRKP
eukprot:Skav236578  [mRNA]  locus=scaffold2180:297003:297561:- [translate_table: standard]